MKVHTQALSSMASQQSYGALFVRFFVAPLLSLFSGFHTMDFIMGGLYTWPQMSRVIALTLAFVILSYEFVYKENREQASYSQGMRMSQQGLKAILYSCFAPYVLGVLLLLSLVLVSQ